MGSGVTDAAGVHVGSRVIVGGGVMLPLPVGVASTVAVTVLAGGTVGSGGCPPQALSKMLISAKRAMPHHNPRRALTPLIWLGGGRR